MAYMRHSLLALMLLAACADDRPDPAADLCNDTATSSDKTPRIAECEARCKTGDGTAELCAPEMEVACIAECVRCNPQQAWCPRD